MRVFSPRDYSFAARYLKLFLRALTLFIDANLIRYEMKCLTMNDSYLLNALTLRHTQIMFRYSRDHKITFARIILYFCLNTIITFYHDTLYVIIYIDTILFNLSIELYFRNNEEALNFYIFVKFD